MGNKTRPILGEQDKASIRKSERGPRKGRAEGASEEWPGGKQDGQEMGSGATRPHRHCCHLSAAFSRLHWPSHTLQAPLITVCHNIPKRLVPLSPLHRRRLKHREVTLTSSVSPRYKTVKTRLLNRMLLTQNILLALY